MSTVTLKSPACMWLLTLIPASCLAAAALSQENGVKELSVAPLDHIEYPESRPAWVSDSPQTDGKSFRAVVVGSPSDSPEESQEALRWMQRAVVADMVSQIAQSDGRSDFYPLSDEEIERNLVTRQYVGEVTQGNRTRYEHAVEIEFLKAEQGRVRKAWQQVEVRHRLRWLGVATLSGLTLLIGSSVLTGFASRRTQRRDLHHS